MLERDLTSIKTALQAQRVETPSWGYGDSGTRFKTFAWPGAARDVWEKLEDAAFIHAQTGIAPSVALHIPWDRVEDYGELREYAEARGVRLGAINPNLFQHESYRLGSLANPDAGVRARALAHLLECVQVMRDTGSGLLSLWFADGTNYAGQDDFRRRKRDLSAGLRAVHGALPEGSRMLLEYKPFEPACYHTDLADWGMAYALCTALGPKAQVLVDMGHHLPGANVEHIVAFLLDEGRLGGFHFNGRKYADDDVIVGSVNPFELFCVYLELVTAETSADEALRRTAGAVACMLDQSHAVEGKLGATLQSVLNCQSAYAKALLVDRDALAEAQAEGDALGAHRLLMAAYETDVRPLLRELREEMGLEPDPWPALRDYEAGVYKARLRTRPAEAVGSGYPSGG